MQAGLARTLRPLALGLLGFYGGLVGYWWLFLRPDVAPLAVAWGTAAALMAGLAWIGRPGLRGQAAEGVLAAVVLVVTAASATLLVTTGAPELSLALYVIVLGFGLLAVSRWTLMLAVAGSLASWAWAFAVWGGEEWHARGIALAACSIIAFVVHGNRVRMQRGLEETRRLEVQAGLRAQQAELGRRDAERKSSFMRLAAHELATPVTTMVIDARNLESEPLQGNARAAATRLARNVARVERLVRDLIALAQHQAGHMTMATTAVPLQSVMEQAVREALARYPGRAVSMDEGEAGLAAHADAHRLDEALRRLVENALRFTAADGHTRVWASRQGERVLIRVEDDGPGLPEPQAARLRAAHESPLDLGPPAESGMGLTVVRLLVEAQGGTLRHEPRTPRGSTFTIDLPAA